MEGNIDKILDTNETKGDDCPYPCGCEGMEHITVKCFEDEWDENGWQTVEQHCDLYCHLHHKYWEVKYEKINV